MINGVRLVSLEPYVVYRLDLPALPRVGERVLLDSKPYRVVDVEWRIINHAEKLTAISVLVEKEEPVQ
jgi:hypothetical protein